MKARSAVLALTVCAIVLSSTPAQAASGGAGPIACTWGGTPAAPTGVFTAHPGITNAPSSEPIQFRVTGELAGGAQCAGSLSFVGTIARGTTCLANAAFTARAFGVPGVWAARSEPGALGTQPVLLYDRAGNVVGSEQAQFLSEAFKQFDSAFWDCDTSNGLTRANWSDTVELFMDHT